MEPVVRTELSSARTVDWRKARQCQFKGAWEACGGGPAAHVCVNAPVYCVSVVLTTRDRAPVGLALFLGSMGIMEGRDKRHIQEKFQDLYKPLLITNWQVWPTVQVSRLLYAMRCRLFTNTVS